MWSPFCGLFVWAHILCNVCARRVFIYRNSIDFDLAHFNEQTVIELCRFQFVDFYWFSMAEKKNVFLSIGFNRFSNEYRHFNLIFNLSKPPSWTFLISPTKEPSKVTIVYDVELPLSWNKTWLNWIKFEKKFSIWAFDPFPFRNRAMHSAKMKKRKTKLKQTESKVTERHTFIWKVKQMPLQLIPCNFHIQFCFARKEVLLLCTRFDVNDVIEMMCGEYVTMCSYPLTKHKRYNANAKNIEVNKIPNNLIPKWKQPQIICMIFHHIHLCFFAIWFFSFGSEPISEITITHRFETWTQKKRWRRKIWTNKSTWAYL